MKRLRIGSPIPFLLAGLLIGTLLTLQLKSDVLNMSSHPYDEYEFQREVLQTFVDEQVELEERLSEITAQVEEEEERISQLYGSIDSEARQELRDLLGLSEIMGDGIEIVLADSPSVDREDSLPVDFGAYIQAADLRDLVNLLRTFPNEGVTINNRRIVVSTPISSAGNSILINNFHVAPPFTVQMVTEVPDLVIQKLSSETELSSVYDRVVSHGLQFKFKERDNLTLPAYLGGYSTNFITATDDE